MPDNPYTKTICAIILLSMTKDFVESLGSLRKDTTKLEKYAYVMILFFVILMTVVDVGVYLRIVRL